MSRTILPIWLLALIGAILVGVAAASSWLAWLPIVLAGVVLSTFAVQLALRRKEGLVTRMAQSIGGALVILAVATAILAVAHPAVPV